ncbi:MAG: RelA/SpoT domain-containing protein [Candidatus Omnitrophica bacterium]|nr:RelA/SpoT domain-containing protein [Candidatus Omnitrophota bacterium]
MEDLNQCLEKLEREYQDKKILYDKFRFEIVKQLNELLAQPGVMTVVPIESRLKELASIRDKCERLNITPQKLGEITDLVGLRVVLISNKDSVKVCDIIERNFDVLEKEDTRQRLADNQFGYGSIHYLVRPPKDWLNLPTLRGLNGLIAEVQVRTASQHIWATVSHNLQYKKINDVPVPLRRSINRVAALLELVDLEFDRVLTERKDYIREIGSISKVEPLNTETLKNILENLLPKENKGDYEDYADLLEDLRNFDVTNVKQLEEIVKKQWTKVQEREKVLVEETKQKIERGLHLPSATRNRNTRGVFFTHVGLARTAMRMELGKKFVTYLINKRTKAKQSV